MASIPSDNHNNTMPNIAIPIATNMNLQPPLTSKAPALAAVPTMLEMPSNTTSSPLPPIDGDHIPQNFNRVAAGLNHWGSIHSDVSLSCEIFQLLSKIIEASRKSSNDFSMQSFEQLQGKFTKQKEEIDHNKEKIEGERYAAYWGAGGSVLGITVGGAASWLLGPQLGPAAFQILSQLVPSTASLADKTWSIGGTYYADEAGKAAAIDRFSMGIHDTSMQSSKETSDAFKQSLQEAMQALKDYYDRRSRTVNAIVAR